MYLYIPFIPYIPSLIYTLQYVSIVTTCVASCCCRRIIVAYACCVHACKYKVCTDHIYTTASTKLTVIQTQAMRQSTQLDKVANGSIGSLHSVQLRLHGIQHIGRQRRHADGQILFRVDGQLMQVRRQVDSDRSICSVDVSMQSKVSLLFHVDEGLIGPCWASDPRCDPSCPANLSPNFGQHKPKLWVAVNQTHQLKQG